MIKIFTIYDSKAENYLNPVYRETLGLLMRDLEGALQDREHMFAKHPMDFTLFELGSYDSSTGQINTLEAKKNIGNLHELFRSVASTDYSIDANSDNRPQPRLIEDHKEIQEKVLKECN